MIGAFADGVYTRMLKKRPEIDENIFAKWFDEKCVYISWQKDDWGKRFDYSDYHSQIGDCHANALFNAIEHKLDLYAGFMIQPWKAGGTVVVVHSFNMDHHKIIDPTIYCNQDQFPNCIFPFSYVGVEIPRGLIDKVSQQFIQPAIEEGRRGELKYRGMLVPYFLDSNEKDWSYIFNS